MTKFYPTWNDELSDIEEILWEIWWDFKIEIMYFKMLAWWKWRNVLSLYIHMSLCLSVSLSLSLSLSLYIYIYIYMYIWQFYCHLIFEANWKGYVSITTFIKVPWLLSFLFLNQEYIFKNSKKMWSVQFTWNVSEKASGNFEGKDHFCSLI